MIEINLLESYRDYTILPHCAMAVMQKEARQPASTARAVSDRTLRFWDFANSYDVRASIYRRSIYGLPARHARHAGAPHPGGRAAPRVRHRPGDPAIHGGRHRARSRVALPFPAAA